MNFGDEYCERIPSDFDFENMSVAKLDFLSQGTKRITRFHSSPDFSLIYNSKHPVLGNSLCYRINSDCLIEITDSFLRQPFVIHNRVSDLISFQFVSTVKRSEFLGDRKNIHDLGPAIIVSVVPDFEETYRIPKINESIRHVVVYTTLSNLMERMGESKQDYPAWLKEILDGEFKRPRQRILFLESIHRDLTWPCFHLPVSDSLLAHWMLSKFTELLCVGLQVLKETQGLDDFDPVESPPPRDEKIQKVVHILNQEYANPPPLSVLANHLGISDTHLKSGFKSMFGLTVMQYCISKRMEAAKLLLAENKHSVSEIGSIVGYQDHSAFCRVFRQRSGCTPSQWHRSRNAS
jgi:AraC-like DNA-binding protein